jgi:hypothetical protein
MDDQNQAGTETKTRKQRSDKGTTRKTVRTRKKPDYFVQVEGGISQAVTREDAIQLIDKAYPAQPRVIVGREITFTRQINFHL